MGIYNFTSLLSLIILGLSCLTYAGFTPNSHKPKAFPKRMLSAYPTEFAWPPTVNVYPAFTADITYYALDNDTYTLLTNVSTNWYFDSTTNIERF